MIPLRIINYNILTLEVIRGQYRSKTVKWENSARDIIICIHAHMIATRIIKYIILTSEFIKGHYRSDLTYKNCDISPKTFGLEVGETIPLLLRFQRK